jgi:hypothetical protein
MTEAKVLEAAAAVAVRLSSRLAQPERYEGGFKPILPEAEDHCLWMCGQIPGFVAADRLGKAMRWLGFVQGVCWVAGVFSLEELQAMNRADATEGSPPAGEGGGA